MSRDGVLGILMGAAVGTLLLVPANGSAQDSLSVRCGYDVSLLEAHIRCAEQGDTYVEACQDNRERT